MEKKFGNRQPQIKNEPKAPESQITPDSLLQLFLIIGKIQGPPWAILSGFGWQEYKTTPYYRSHLEKIINQKK